MNLRDATNIQADIHCLLKNWGRETNCQQSFDWMKRFPTSGSPSNAATLHAQKLILDWLAHFEVLSPESALILKLRFIDNKTIRQVAYDLDYSVDQINRKQRLALEQFSNFIHTKYLEQLETDRSAIRKQLPFPTQSKLFGFQPQIVQLANLIATKNTPWIIVLVGLGGLGKTSLANAIIKDISTAAVPPHYFAWINMDDFSINGTVEETSKEILSRIASKFFPKGVQAEQKLEQTQYALNEFPSLVVLDGIPEKIELTKIIEAIQPWANPSKFLLTSRNKGVQTSPAYLHQLRELDQKHAIDLFLYQASISDIEGLDQLTAPLEQRIYATVGGNPLALKLIAGLLDTFSLEFILQDIENCQINDVQSMYEYVYLKAWNALNLEAQQLLLTMPLVSLDGGTLEHIGFISTLTGESLVNAIHTLNQKSLIEVLGDLAGKRYRIHHLTRSFLKTHIIQWPPK